MGFSYETIFGMMYTGYVWIQVVVTFQLVNLIFILLTLLITLIFIHKIRQDGHSYYEDSFQETFLSTDW